MTTLAKIAANRQNAMKSTGPRTAAGKAAAGANAIAHGLRSAAPVIPGEDPADWEAYRAGVVAALAPAGTLEAELADRVASLSWRLRRAGRPGRDPGGRPGRDDRRRPRRAGPAVARLTTAATTARPLPPWVRSAECPPGRRRAAGGVTSSVNRRTVRGGVRSTRWGLHRRKARVEEYPRLTMASFRAAGAFRQRC
jgi:hypothetical protein